MKEEQKNTLVHAINHFGVEGQINKAVEEMGELITELSRRNISRFDKDKVAEEIADALIMLEQLRIIFEAQKVDSYVTGKLERLEKTISKVAKTSAVFVPEKYVRERTAAVAPKRRTTNGDHVEAAFHGEVWARCRLCGKAYEQQTEVHGEMPGESYCPWCNGYGKEDGI